MKKLRQDGGYGVNTKAKLYTSTTETENKRFLNNGSMIFDNRTPLTTTETVDLLNEFNDENQRITSLLQSERRELIEQNNNYRKLLNELAEENEKLHDKIFRLRTELAYDRTEKEKHSHSVYDFKKKLEKW